MFCFVFFYHLLSQFHWAKLKGLSIVKHHSSQITCKFNKLQQSYHWKCCYKIVVGTGSKEEEVYRYSKENKVTRVLNEAQTKLVQDRASHCFARSREGERDICQAIALSKGKSLKGGLEEAASGSVTLKG